MYVAQARGFKLGDHVCSLYSSSEEQLAAALEYIRAGLARGERCQYFCGEQTVPEFRAALKSAGVDVEHEETRGALVLKTTREGYQLDVPFVPEEMLGSLERAVTEALDAGFTGLCSAADMTWLLESEPGRQRQAEYEAKLNHFHHSEKAVIFCQYNRNSLPSDVIDHCIATHRHIRSDGAILLENAFYEPDDRAMNRQAADPEIVAEKLDIIDATRFSLRAPQ